MAVARAVIATRPPVLASMISFGERLIVVPWCDGESFSGRVSTRAAGRALARRR
jgi:hypothetical protein